MEIAIIIIGNFIALIASILMVYSGYVKEKKKILFFQTTQIALSIISNIVLGGITGAIINTLSFIRNVLCYNDKLKIIAKIILSILAISLSLIFNNLGIWGILPLISTITYLWLMDVKDVIKFKILIIFTMVLWFMYDMRIMSYTSAIFDLGTAFTNIISIIQIKNKKKKENVNKNE